jgi:uncharacterized membrane protein
LQFKQVPAGTNGGVSKLGTISSILGGTAIGISYYISGILFASSYQQFSLIVVGAVSGFLGSMVNMNSNIDLIYKLDR